MFRGRDGARKHVLCLGCLSWNGHISRVSFQKRATVRPELVRSLAVNFCAEFPVFILLSATSLAYKSRKQVRESFTLKISSIVLKNLARLFRLFVCVYFLYSLLHYAKVRWLLTVLMLVGV